MPDSRYYDGAKLLSLMDVNGNKPEIYMCCGNRTGGKTTYFARMLVRRFLNHGSKFMLLYRYTYEIADVAEKFFKDVGSLFFKGRTMESKTRHQGAFAELFLDEEPCGYAVALNKAEQVKKLSHFFSDVDAMFFDEFQSETNTYCSEEIAKFMSVHISVARGQGKQHRYVPVYMCSNAVSIINPYFVELGISERLRTDTNFLKGDGFVLEQAWVESAARAQEESAFMRAFGRNKYAEYASQNVYLNDNTAFVAKPEGRSRYIATIRYNGCDFAIREYPDEGILYCDNRADHTFPTRVAVTTEDHRVNYVMLKRSDFLISNLRWFFDNGAFRFKDLKAKSAVMKMLSY